MKLIPIDAEDEKLLRSTSGRGRRISFPVLQTFLGSGLSAAKLDRTEFGEEMTAPRLVARLNGYAKSHEMNVIVIQRGGEVYLLRPIGETT